MNQVKVGVIGASPLAPGWASVSHLPAIQSVEGFELSAVSTSRADSAEAARQAYGVPAYADPSLMIADPDVDLVVVAVKTPFHHRYSIEALEAGKMVYTEWPLGVNLAEAEDIARRSLVAGVRTVIGLQSSYAPAVRKARQLIDDGYIGRFLGSTLVTSAIAWGPTVAQRNAYWYDKSNGAGPLSVPGMHALEAMIFVLGPIARVASVAETMRPRIQVIDDGSIIESTVHDHVAISCSMRNGGVASVFIRGHVSRGGNLRWEINGTEGDLVLTSGIGNLQVADLELKGARGSSDAVAPIEIGGSETGGAEVGTGMGANVARQYAALAADLRTGAANVPDFQHALNRHRLLAAIEESSETNRAVEIDA